MEIIKNSKLLLILLPVLFISACVSTKMVTVTNDTAESVTFLAKFISNEGSSNELEFVLNPGAINSWHYEVRKFESDQLDKGLTAIVLIDAKGCKVALDRADIERVAEKDGMWKFTINKSVMKCY